MASIYRLLRENGIGIVAVARSDPFSVGVFVGDDNLYGNLAIEQSLEALHLVEILSHCYLETGLQQGKEGK